jgi:hypothetical protein
MNGKVKSMNIRLDWTLMRYKSDIGVTGKSSIAGEDYTKHGQHLNSGGKKRLTHALCINSIPVITLAGASPFLA